MNYEQYFGLKEQPFAITPDPRYFFESDQHMGALIRIQHAIDAAKGLTVVIGDMGLGKTFLSRKILDNLQSEEGRYEVALLIIIHHEITASWLLKKISIQLGIENPADDKSTLISQICKQLIHLDEAGKRVVLLIDEAHMLQTKEIYEELRGLLNIEGSNHKLLNIVLFGPPELEQFMQMDPPLISRIGLKVTLKPLDQKSTIDYIDYRLRIAGSKKEIFTPAASRQVFEFTSGVPRLINATCDNALLEAFMHKKEKVEPDIVDQVSGELGLKKA